MKRLLAIAVLAIAVAAPAFAQPNARTRASHEHPYMEMYGAKRYQARAYQQDVNPDFHLGGNTGPSLR